MDLLDDLSVHLAANGRGAVELVLKVRTAQLAHGPIRHRKVHVANGIGGGARLGVSAAKAFDVQICSRECKKMSFVFNGDVLKKFQQLFFTNGQHL